MEVAALCSAAVLEEAMAEEAEATVEGQEQSVEVAEDGVDMRNATEQSP